MFVRGKTEMRSKVICRWVRDVFSADEDLIKWGWQEDVWFHVDKVSSAHVYLRLNPVSESSPSSH